jgi:DNA invertase Pin-like site-specific DNA recombinase
MWMSCWCSRIDRLARNVFDHAMIKALLKQRSTKLASVVENIDDSVSGELVENIMASIAQFYSGTSMTRAAAFATTLIRKEFCVSRLLIESRSSVTTRR